MSFTYRFIKIPIKVYNTQDADLMGHKTFEDTWMKINPIEISQYKPSHDDDNESNCTYLSMRNGDGFYLYLTTDEFEELLNTHQK